MIRAPHRHTVLTPLLPPRLELYFATFGTSIPFLGSRDRYTEALEPLSTRCSSFAAAAVGLSFAGTESRGETDEIFKTAQKLSASAPESGTNVDATTSLDLIAGNVLLAYIFYGREELGDAQAHLHQSARVALQIKLHDGSSDTGNDALAGMRQSIWLELQVANALLSASTGGRIRPYDSSELFTRATRLTEHKIASPLGDRAEAALLLHECIRPTTTSAGGLQRVRHLDHMLLNHIAKVQTGRYTMHQRSKSMAGLEACLVDTLLLLHA